MKERPASQDDRDVVGLSPTSGSTFNPSETIVVILGARNESRLRKLCDRLEAAGIPHVPIYEPDAPWNGALMSIGLVPGLKADLSAHVNDFHMFRELEPA